MLVLSRKVGESIKLADDIEITVLAVDHQRVRLGIRAPRHVEVRRSTPDVNLVKENQDAALQPNLADKKTLLSKAASAKNKQE